MKAPDNNNPTEVADGDDAASQPIDGNRPCPQPHLLRSGLHVITETAIHEASHLVTYLSLDVPVEFATIAGAESLVASAMAGVPDPDTLGLNGLTRIGKSQRISAVYGALGGYAGETVLLDTSDTIDLLLDVAEDDGGRTDVIAAMEAAIAWYIGLASYDNSTGAITMHNGTAIPEDIERRVVRYALSLVNRAWKRLLRFFDHPEVRLAVWEIAVRLIRDGRIDGSVASEIVERTGAARKANPLNLQIGFANLRRVLATLDPQDRSGSATTDRA